MTSSDSVKYGDLLVEWLQELGYTHCFFVAGGNNMHLLNAVRNRLRCVPFVHEVSAGIAAEYFNESDGEGRAFVLVTAGPGMTQLVSALAGAFLESRELLVLGGQVKSSDLIADSGVRQRGIQEIDGVALAEPICVRADRMVRPMPRAWLVEQIEAGTAGRPGPVFLEVCLDVQGAPVSRVELEGGADVPAPPLPSVPAGDLERLLHWLAEAERPLLLLGGGLRRDVTRELVPALRELGIPFQTTWNGMDRVGADEPLFFGRPNTWGQRYANVILQQSDLVVALGSRLGLQQTGFNWQGFVPAGRVVQVEIDPTELAKGHPRVDLPLRGDANEVLRAIVASPPERREGWIGFCERVRELLPLDERSVNETHPGYLSPFAFCLELSERCAPEDVVVPCSSGGANFVMMQSFRQKTGQIVVTDKGLASMGYGLGGAIGAALAHPGRRTVLVEGDGGFCQNLQELATVGVNGLNLKTFIFANQGYASIRMTQRNYFDGEYLGCDTQTGLGFPDWSMLFAAFGIPFHALGEAGLDDPEFEALFTSDGPAAFVVPIDPEQTYLPKIASRVTETGSMESNPLHHMTPPLPEEVAAEVFAYVPAGPDA